MSNSQAYQENHWEDIDILCDYLEGTLSDEQHGLIESEIIRSATLASRIEGIKYFFNGEKVNREALREFLINSKKQQEKLISEHFAKKKSTKTFTYSRFAIAAVILALFGIGITFFLYKPTSPSPQIFAEQALSIPYTFPSSQIRSFDSSNETSYWLKAYQSRNYSETIAQLQSISPLNEQQTFALGLSYLYSNKHQEARSLFQKILKNQSINSLFTDQARWYLVLSYLKTKEYTAARSVLKIIHEEGEAHYRYSEAEKVLGELGN